MAYDFAFHNSHKVEYREPFGAVIVGRKVKIKILIEKNMKVELNLIYFNGLKENIKMNYEGQSESRALYSADINTTDSIGLIKYYFTLEKKGTSLFYGNNEKGLGGEGKIYYSNPKPYQITVYNEEYIPEWFKEGIIYQIFVDRFYNGNDDGKISNPKKNSFIYAHWQDEPMYIKDRYGSVERWDFYGGNLKGIINKLPYLKSLGITIIYLNPIFEASSCHKYDTGDYEKIDGMFGDEEDFVRLCDEGRKNGIRIILDGVFSHTGADSKYFNKFSTYPSIGAFQSKESPYYNWYRFYDYPNQYECWWGINNQPNVDELNESYLDYIIVGENSIISKWIKNGASGWRLDVADELPDKFIKLIKSKMREINKETILIGEVWEDASNKISYSEQREYLFGGELDSVTNYPLRKSVIEYVKGNILAKEFVDVLMSIYENYPKENFYSNMNLLGNHDTERILTVLENDIKNLELALVIQMTLPGVPLIYYGDEAGLTGGKDPSNRKTYPWDSENNEIIDIYRKFIKVRKSDEIFTKGSFDLVFFEDNVLIYKRSHNGRKVFVIINACNEERNIKLGNDFNGSFRDIIKDEKLELRNINNNVLNIKNKGYMILKEI